MPAKLNETIKDRYQQAKNQLEEAVKLRIDSIESLLKTLDKESQQYNELEKFKMHIKAVNNEIKRLNITGRDTLALINCAELTTTFICNPSKANAGKLKQFASQLKQNNNLDPTWVGHVDTILTLAAFAVAAASGIALLPSFGLSMLGVAAGVGIYLTANYFFGKSSQDINAKRLAEHSLSTSLNKIEPQQAATTENVSNSVVNPTPDEVAKEHEDTETTIYRL